MKRIITFVLAFGMMVTAAVAAPSKQEVRDEAYKAVVKDLTQIIYAEPDVEVICIAYAYLKAFPELHRQRAEASVDSVVEDWKEFTKRSGWTRDEYIQWYLDLMEEMYLERIKKDMTVYLN